MSLLSRIAGRTSPLIIILIVTHTGLLCYSGWRHFPNIDEAAHLAAGAAHVQAGNFSRYHVNPPLVRLVGALPLSGMGGDLDWSGAFENPATRMEFAVGFRFIEKHGLGSRRYFAVARWACVPFAIIGLLACYIYGRRVFGYSGGIIAAVIWSFSPTVLAYGAMILPDLAAAGCGLLSLLCFRSWLLHERWSEAMIAGIAAGVTLLTKTTWLVLFVLIPALWALNRLCGVPVANTKATSLCRSLIQLIAILTVALYVLNLGYGFEGTCRPLGRFEFLSESLTGVSLIERKSNNQIIDGTGNRFRGTIAESLPVPVPAAYVSGIDFLKYELEHGYASYLRGGWRHGGWYYYYAYAVFVKMPLGLLILALTTGVVTAIALVKRRMARQQIVDEILLLGPAVVLLVLVSSQTGFNHHVRYALPAFPFCFVWIGKLGQWCELTKHRTGNSERGSRESGTRGNVDIGSIKRAWVVPRELFVKRAFVVAMLGWAIISSLSVYPHSHSYFNELAGGPDNGWKHLHNSNVDWGQDACYLKSWLDKHFNVKKVGIAPFHVVNTLKLGFDSFEPNRWPVPEWQKEWPEEQVGPQPGWYAISLCHLAGEPANSYWGRPREEYKNDPSRSYFRYFEPADTIGYSMNIYHVTLEECNELRRKLGLEELPEGWSRETQESQELRVESREPEDE